MRSGCGLELPISSTDREALGGTVPRAAKFDAHQILTRSESNPPGLSAAFKIWTWSHRNTGNTGAEGTFVDRYNLPP